MNPLKKQYIRLTLLLFAATVLAGITGWVLLYYVFPVHYFQWYPLIPVYFTVLGLCMSSGMIYYSRRKPTKIMTAYMLSRVIKIALTAGCVLLYVWLVGEKTVAMVLTTLILYLFYLFIETLIFYRFEKINRQIRKQDA